MQIITSIPILIDESECIGIDHKLLLEAVTMRGFVIGIGDIADSDTLGTILCPDPVGIGQVDTNSGGRIFIASQHRRTDDIGRDTFDHRFAETRINGRMVFKPLGITTDGLRTLSCLCVDILYQSFPGTFQSQGIAIHLDKAVDEVDGGIVLLQPFDAILIECLQIACPIITYQK